MAENATAKPDPIADPATREYWEGVARHELRLPRCLNCMEVHFYPRPVCPHCGETRFDWIRCSGIGEIYSFTVVRRAPSPAFESDVPYTVAVIALAEGPHMMSAVTGVDVNQVRVGQKVRVQFRDSTAGHTLPFFVLETG